MHVLSADPFTTPEMAEIFEQADDFQKRLQNREGKREIYSTHIGEQIGSIFYEPSTRTKGSFEIAAMKLGMGVFQTENAGEFSSISKGETIEDSVRVLGSYGLAAIVMRTKEEGLVARAASASPVPVINGGDGKGEHPTQALLDAYTIRNEFDRLDGLKVVMGGDLSRGRTVKSLSRLLAKYPNNEITYVSIPELQIDAHTKSVLDAHDTPHHETSDMYEALHEADVVYWTRLQTERSLKGLPEDLEEILEAMKKDSIIMHPLPRIGEIKKEVDADPRARYFQQAENGLYVRMALLDRAVSSKQG
jgi:aspartate carbamoyltransferase catalytic subunit